jgi:biopolymer transport protein ExbD
MARRKHVEDVDLDISPFMNILIVLVPILLTNMTISATTILDLKLPAAAGDGTGSGVQENQQIELIIHDDYMTLNYPAGVYMDQFPKTGDKFDYKAITAKLRQLKPAIEASIGKPKRDILILSEEKTDYQTLVSTMDAVRSYKTVVVTDVVEAELFPEISLGDSPVIAAVDGQQQTGAAP